MPEMLPLCTCTCGCDGARCRVAGVGIQPGLGQSQLRSGCGEREREARQREADRACAASALTTTTHPSATLHSLSPAHTPRTQGVARLASQGRAKPTFGRSPPPPPTHIASLSLSSSALLLSSHKEALTLPCFSHTPPRDSLSLSLSLSFEREGQNVGCCGARAACLRAGFGRRHWLGACFYSAAGGRPGLGLGAGLAWRSQAAQAGGGGATCQEGIHLARAGVQEGGATRYLWWQSRG
jgi:hypothetical protein